jgi:shikimate 5-dehydrogenase
MLVHQGALQFKIWTGLDEPSELMFREAEQALADAKKA